ncbi:MAG: family 31 glucosidase [Pseudobutyrivibrio ruminis]|nr:family 31 glucosidase [Pseudobutyrivibrio ruminis]
MIKEEKEKVVYSYDSETVWIEAWGNNAVRIRATKRSNFTNNNWALSEQKNKTCKISITDEGASLQNGDIKVCVSIHGKIEIYNQKKEKIIEEYSRNRRDVTDSKCSALEVEAREYKPIVGSDNYHLRMRFESLFPDEKIYGMGQYQQQILNLKGSDLELAHRNSQVSVPFAISSKGYGLLWNNPAIGRAVFGKNITSYEAYSAKELDYWVVIGESIKEILEEYTSVTGRTPIMPEYGYGFWQSKLRYQTRNELINIAEEYYNRKIHLDMIVVDFFHWNKQGDWEFDETYWPNPKTMIKKINSMGTEVMVSIWPTVDKNSVNYSEMLEKGYLIHVERGHRVGLSFQGETIHIDVTNPEARRFLWSKVRENYYSLGIKTFWLDEAEPEYSVYDFDNYRYYEGTDLEVGNIYPVCYGKTFFDGMLQEGQKNILNLARCTWAGGQKYGMLIWSGDIASSFESMKIQLVAGLNMGLAGIPWWTTDIGGFHGGNPSDSRFRELFARWFAWATFCPVMRLHGDREPRQPQYGDSGGATCCSGADNEIWSYGNEVYEICKKYISIREKLRPYIRKIMLESHKNGSPIMRTLFYEFPEDAECWNVEDEYMFGGDILVSPILVENCRERTVYLPRYAKWQEYETGIVYEGGQMINVETPIDVIPFFIRDENIVLAAQ